MPSLAETIADPARRKKVIEDAVGVIEAEVADKSGLTGIAVKTAFGTVQRLKPGFVHMALHHLLDDFSKQVDPFWAECQAQKAVPRTFFVQRGKDIANALLKITDDRSKKAAGPARSAYEQLRPRAVDHVVAAMPRLGDLVQKHCS